MLFSFDAVDISDKNFVNYTANHLVLLFLSLLYLLLLLC